MDNPLFEQSRKKKCMIKLCVTKRRVPKKCE